MDIKIMANKIKLDISHVTVHNTLKKNEIKPWKVKQWCIPKADAEFVLRMEDILDLYETEYDSKNPVVCVDEQPYQLLNHKIEPIPLKKGQPKKIDYEYEREGTCNIFMITEPFADFRATKATERRTRGGGHVSLIIWTRTTPLINIQLMAILKVIIKTIRIETCALT